MRPKKYSSSTLELYWWLLTIVVTALVLFPIYYFFPEYPLGLNNGLFIVIFITLARYIFFLKYTFLAKNQRFKVVLFFLMIPLTFFLVQSLFSFQIMVEDGKLIKLLDDIEYPLQKYLASYIQKEYIFFLVAATLSAIIFAFRSLQSVWLLRNRGRV